MKTINEIYQTYDAILKKDIWYLNGGVFYPKDRVPPKDLQDAVNRYKTLVLKLDALRLEAINLKKRYNMKTITIKVNDEATEEKVVSLLKEHAPEMFEAEFSMLGYLRDIETGVEYELYSLGKAHEKRLRALLKIWEWKEKNDKGGAKNYAIFLRVESETFGLSPRGMYENNTELPYFSTEEIAQRALKELEAEYKVVFNVK